MTHPETTTPANPAQGVSDEMVDAFIKASSTAAGDTEDCVRAGLSAAMSAGGETPVGKWAIDRSTDSPILTYENCSVIQDEQAFYVLDLVRAAIGAGGQAVAEDWRDDPSADERWNAGLDYGQTQLCNVLGVDPKTIDWDAATETLDGDVQSVIGKILTARFGDDWLSNPPAQPGWRDMSSAPKDGTWFLCRNPDSPMEWGPFGFCSRQTDHTGRSYWADEDTSEEIYPTGWFPLDFLRSPLSGDA